MESQPTKVPEAEELEVEYTIEPVGKSEIQIAYAVRNKGRQIGMIFQIRSTWQCGDGVHYKNSGDAINGLEALTSKRTDTEMLQISPGRYTSLDGAIEVAQQGEIMQAPNTVVKLWKNTKSNFYHRTASDAMRIINPAAIRASDIKTGDTILTGGGKETLVSCILSGFKQNMNSIRIVCENGVEINRFFFELVEINNSYLKPPMKTSRLSREFFSVESDSGKTYTVTPYRNNPRDRCTCPGAKKGGHKCRHQKAVEEFIKADVTAIEHELDKLIAKYP